MRCAAGMPRIGFETAARQAAVLASAARGARAPGPAPRRAGRQPSAANPGTQDASTAAATNTPIIVSASR